MITTLKRIVEEVIRQPVLEHSLERVVSQVKEAMQTECCSIYLTEHKQQHFLLSATDGLSPDAVGNVKIGFSEGLVSLVGQREEPVNIANSQQHPRFLVTPQVNEDAYNAFLGAPIIHQRKVLGVITVQQTESRHFDEDEVAFLVTLAAQLAAAIVYAKARDVVEDCHTGECREKGRILNGVPGATGLGVGQAYVFQTHISFSSIIPKRHKNVDKEKQRFNQAIILTRQQLSQLSIKMRAVLPSEASAIFDVYSHLLSDASLGVQVLSHIDAGWNAESALKFVIDETVNEFAALDDDYIRERVTDIKDMGQRVLVNILEKELAKRKPPKELILVADDVTATMLAEFPRQSIKGVCSRFGSSSSHASILAKALGIPAVMGLNDLPLNTMDGQNIILDGYCGQVHISPNDTLLAEYQRLIIEENELDELVQQVAQDEAKTKDGIAVSLSINTGLAADLSVAKNIDVNGIGLYRTEIPFMVRERFPTENEQVDIYKQLFQAYPDKPVTIRTLDVGGDKPLPYFPITEDNPFLGWRGIRLTLDHPEILLVQLRAMLRANAAFSNLNILLPMISSVSEVEESLRLIHQAHREINEELQQDLAWPKIGIMIEVPVTIYQISHLAKYVDYFSIGTNDLTQYLLAVDRNNARVASLYDYYHPGVLQALKYIIEQANEHNIPVTVCGEMAGEPIGLLLLLAMGYRSFSMNAHNVLKAKWILKNTSLGAANTMLNEIECLTCPSEIKNLLYAHLEGLGLGGFVRAGK